MKMHTTSAIVVLLASTTQVMGSSRTASDVDDGVAVSTLNGQQHSVVTPRGTEANVGDGELQDSPYKRGINNQKQVDDTVGAPLTARNLQGLGALRTQQQSHAPSVSGVSHAQSRASHGSTGTMFGAKDGHASIQKMREFKTMYEGASDLLKLLDPQAAKHISSYEENLVTLIANNRASVEAVSYLVELIYAERGRFEPKQFAQYKNAVRDILLVVTGVQAVTTRGSKEITYRPNIYTDSQKIAGKFSTFFHSMQNVSSEIELPQEGSLLAVSTQFKLNWMFAKTPDPQEPTPTTTTTSNSKPSALASNVVTPEQRVEAKEEENKQTSAKAQPITTVPDKDYITTKWRIISNRMLTDVDKMCRFMQLINYDHRNLKTLAFSDDLLSRWSKAAPNLKALRDWVDLFPNNTTIRPLMSANLQGLIDVLSLSDKDAEARWTSYRDKTYSGFWSRLTAGGGIKNGKSGKQKLFEVHLETSINSIKEDLGSQF